MKPIIKLREAERETKAFLSDLYKRHEMTDNEFLYVLSKIQTQTLNFNVRNDVENILPKKDEPKENLYRIEFYYLATGMEGHADHRVVGHIEGFSKEDALDRIIDREYSHMSESEQNWMRGCLTAYPEVRGE